jgi:hypothetical protein
MSELSRRSLIAGFCGVAALSLSPLTAEGATVVKKAAGGKLSIRVKDIPKVVDVGSSVQVGKVKGQPVALFRTGRSTSVSYTHLRAHETLS